MSAKVTVTNPDTLGPAIAPYSQSASANGFVYVAGQVGLDKDNNVVAPGDVRAQTKVALDRVRTILADYDADLSDIVYATVYLTNLDDFAAFNEAWAEELGDHRPARAAVIAGLLLDGLVVEIVPVVAL